MKKYLISVGVLLLLLSGGLNCCYAQANPASSSTEVSYEVTPLINRAYYAAVNKALKKAKKSILVVMYVMDKGKHASDPPRVLLNNLIKAHKKGVKVEVLLEKPKSLQSSIYQTNRQTYEFLRSKGIRVSSPRRPVFFPALTIVLSSSN